MKSNSGVLPDKYLATNPDMKPEDVIKEGDDLPF